MKPPSPPSAAKGWSLVGAEHLAAADELQGLLVGRVARRQAALVQGLQHHLGVGQVRPLAVAVAGPAVPGVGDGDRLARFGVLAGLGPLVGLEPDLGIADRPGDVAVAARLGRQEHQRDAGVVVLEHQAGPVDAAVLLAVAQDEGQGLADDGAVRAVVRVLGEGLGDDGGDGWVGHAQGLPGAVGRLDGLEVLQAPLHGGVGLGAELRGDGDVGRAAWRGLWLRLRLRRATGRDCASRHVQLTCARDSDSVLPGRQQGVRKSCPWTSKPLQRRACTDATRPRHDQGLLGHHASRSGISINTLASLVNPPPYRSMVTACVRRIRAGLQRQARPTVVDTACQHAGGQEAIWRTKNMDPWPTCRT